MNARLFKQYGLFDDWSGRGGDSGFDWLRCIAAEPDLGICFVPAMQVTAHTDIECQVLHVAEEEDVRSQRAAGRVPALIGEAGKVAHSPSTPGGRV